MSKTWFVFTLMIYIRLMMQSSQFMMLASYSEILAFHSNEDSTISSLTISILCLL